MCFLSVLCYLLMKATDCGRNVILCYSPFGLEFGITVSILLRPNREFLFARIYVSLNHPYISSSKTMWHISQATAWSGALL